MMDTKLLKQMTDEFPKLMMKGDKNTWILKCPFHKDPRGRDLAQFFVNVHGKSFYCLGCAERGTLKELKDMLKEKELDKNQVST